MLERRVVIVVVIDNIQRAATRNAEFCVVVEAIKLIVINSVCCISRPTEGLAKSQTTKSRQVEMNHAKGAQAPVKDDKPTHANITPPNAGKM